eukprot:217628-Chlamydomonas_euryale.AAC.2
MCVSVCARGHVLAGADGPSTDPSEDRARIANGSLAAAGFCLLISKVSEVQTGSQGQKGFSFASSN